MVLDCNDVSHPLLVAYEESSLAKLVLGSSALIYLIFYVVLFCSGSSGGGNHNNEGKGHKRSRYNCCNDAGYTKVNQCCKFETKTKLKLAYGEDLHAVSNQGLTLRIRAYDQVHGRGGRTTPMSHAAKIAYESFGVLLIAVCHTPPLNLLVVVLPV